MNLKLLKLETSETSFYDGATLKSVTKSLKLSTITVDEDIQPRADGLDQSVVDDYIERIGEADEFPPLVVYIEGKKKWLSEGFHRYAAFTAAGLTEAMCDVRTGTLTEAKLNALASNKTHGLRRSGNDKRRAIEKTLALCPQWSDRKIAQWIGVSHPTVSGVRSAAAEVTRDKGQGTAAEVTRNKEQGTSTERKKEESTEKPEPAAEAVAPEREAAVPEREVEEPAAEVVAEEPTATDSPDPWDDESPDAGQQPEPADSFVKSCEAVCRDIDQIVHRVKYLKLSPFCHTIHTETVIHHIQASRKAMWQGRPTSVCPYCRIGGEVSKGCTACHGTNRVTQTTYESGTAAVGGEE